MEMSGGKLDVGVRDENPFGNEINNKYGGHWFLGGQ